MITLQWNGCNLVVERTENNTVAARVLDSNGETALFVEVPRDEVRIEYPPESLAEQGATPLLRLDQVIVPLNTSIALALAELETRDGVLQ
ncbi:MAG: hypothetical protein R3F10_03490 [Lysobacteraceae bacterium]